MLPPASALDVKQPFRGPFALLRRALALLGVAGLLGAAAPAGASARVDVSRQQLEARVLAVRSTLAGLDSSRRQADDPARVVVPMAQLAELEQLEQLWMREFGFLSMEFGETALSDLLIAKPNKALHTATLGDSIRKVVAVMHQHGVSQMPVVGRNSELVGLIEEVDLLNHMLEKHEHTQNEPIDPLVQNASAVFPTETSLEEAMPSLKSGLALIVVENSKP